MSSPLLVRALLPKDPLMTNGSPPRPASYDKKVGLVLQGGGALGSYQAGVYEALASSEYLPDWVAGISIGAINAAIISGNAPEHRVERLRNFWDDINALAAASNVSKKYFPPAGALSGLNMNAARLMPGAISFSRLSHLPPMAGSLKLEWRRQARGSREAFSTGRRVQFRWPCKCLAGSQTRHLRYKPFCLSKLIDGDARFKALKCVMDLFGRFPHPVLLFWSQKSNVRAPRF
jgi:Patatin-like phospholipase